MRYPPKRKPRQKQAEALQAMDGHKAFALFLEMRIGKTKVVLDDWARKIESGEVEDLCVIAPASVYRIWETALQDDVNEALLDRCCLYIWVSNKRADTKPLLQHQGPRILLMNVEALSTVQPARDLCFNFLTRPTMLVIDESTSIKSPTAARTLVVNRTLAKRAAFRRILSGLPTPRSPLDLYAQFEFLDPAILGHRNYDSFCEQYAITQKTTFGGKLRRAINIVVGYKNQDELRDKIAPYSFRAELRECADLPASQYIIRDIEMTKEQERIYKELKKHAMAELEDMARITPTAVITQMLRMHQVLMGRGVDNQENVHSIGEKRTDVLVSLLNETKEKAIIFCSYDADVQKVTAVLRKEFGDNSTARFWGGNRSIREDEEQAFKTDPECRFMVATAAAGGFGRAWDIASITVFYSSTDNLEHRMQAEARQLSVDKIKPMLYIDLIVRGTIEEKILQALRAKIDLAGAITEDNWKSWVV
jgi:SNF2 family DNA or RNA helicase